MTHKYFTKIWWSGTTSTGYDNYNRSHGASAAPALSPLSLSSDPAFRGDPALLNPEQLLVLAASSCQMLSFLATASRARVDIVSYEDSAEAEMPEGKPMFISRIVLRPHISYKGEVSEDRLQHYCEVAHRECFIAHSLKSEIVIQPVFQRAA